MDIRAFKITHDKHLRKYIKQKTKTAQAIAARPRTQQILSYIEEYVFAWGKRIRPYLIYLAYKLYWGKKDEEVISFSWSKELVHTLALIHDDIIDKGELRHGLASFHMFASDIIWGANKAHLWIAQAILAWDLVHAWAYELIYSDYTFKPDCLRAAQKHMQAMIEEVITWQMIDVDSMTGDHVEIEKLEAKNHYKTWQYTFGRPLATWAILAWADKTTIKSLQKIGMRLGKAYQMRDDILDVTITEWDATSHYDNKTKFSDIQDGNPTYITNYIYDNGTYSHRLAISRAMGKRLTPEQIIELRWICIDSGAIAYGIQLLHKYLDEATKLIDKLAVKDPNYKKYLLDIVTLLKKL
jgi:geranylgeranyl pyrophosphate synthase